MHASKLNLLALVAAAAVALPHEGSEEVHDDAPDAQITARAELDKRVDATAVWVSVDDEGSPAATYTPSMVTEDGTTTVTDGAPHDLTASVFTYTSYGKVSTSTGDIPNPSATTKHSEGGFPRCYNTDGDDAPHCYPYADSTLYVDNIYYITWDPDFFNETVSVPSNGTLEVSVRLDYFNRTEQHSDDGEWQKLDEFDRVPASWGVYPLKIESGFLKGAYPHNASINLLYAVQGSADKNQTEHWVPVILDKYRRPAYEEHSKWEHDDLVIALPATFGGIALLLIGGCLWNRKTRRIQLGNVMSRARHGLKSGRKGGGRRRGRGIQLDDQTGRPLYEYRDDMGPEEPVRPRQRSASDLSDLMGIPTSPAVPPQQGQGNAPNTFRDELDRQRQERQRGDMF